jgi:hypothetical protein
VWEQELLEIRKHASDANGIVEAITDELSRYEFNEPSERLRLSLSMLKSSIDLAAASTRLLVLDPIAYGSAFTTLNRPQLERFARGIFFGSQRLAADSDLKCFMQHDKMKKISFDKVFHAALEEINRRSANSGKHGGTEMLAFLKNAKKYLDGAVHGGKVVYRGYYNDMVCFDPRPLADGRLIKNMTAVALVAMTQIIYLHSGSEGTAQLTVSTHFDKMLREYFSANPNFPQPLA